MKLIQHKTKSCVICFEKHYPQNTSYCLNCLECGITCHKCEDKWVNQNNDRKVCIVCKNDTKQNIKKTNEDDKETSIIHEKYMIHLYFIYIVLMVVILIIIFFVILWIIKINK